MTQPDIEVRRAEATDQPGILGLLTTSLGWRPEDPTAELFAWKHSENWFGPSPAWVAVHGDRVVGYRTFMRWRFRRGDDIVDAVRAVDTATHPDFRGQGLFRLLTTRAVEDLSSEGVGFVFNTPNDQSRPGYLKMGWQMVGRLPVAARPGGLRGLTRMTRARQAAELWSVPCRVGESPLDVFGADKAVPGLARADSRQGGAMSTDRDGGYLAWRYGFAPMEYRVWPCAKDRGVLVFRLRRRGAAVEMAVVEGFGRVSSREMHTLVRATRADYAIGLGASRPRPGVPLPGQGPLLTWRALAVERTPRLRDWALSLGDVELF